MHKEKCRGSKNVLQKLILINKKLCTSVVCIYYDFYFYSGCVTTIVKLSPGIKFNGGGHVNHSIFWNNLSPNGGKPSGKWKIILIGQCHKKYLK